MAIRTREMHCPECRHVLDAARPLLKPDASITPDDSYTLCFYCGAMLVFTIINGKLDVRAVTSDELQKFAEEQPDDFSVFMTAMMHIKIRDIPNFINPRVSNN